MAWGLFFVLLLFFCFFLQAEDGIRDSPVTGVQTCALPIFLADKLDPYKAPVYSYQAELHDMALESLDLALLEFLSHEMTGRLERGQTVHPASLDARNSLILKLKS